MGQGDITVWTNWIREENEILMNQLDEELVARGDPDDSFHGSANGVFWPLPDNLSLPPPPPLEHPEDKRTRANSANIRKNRQKTPVGLSKTVLK